MTVIRSFQTSLTLPTKGSWKIILIYITLWSFSFKSRALSTNISASKTDLRYEIIVWLLPPELYKLCHFNCSGEALWGRGSRISVYTVQVTSARWCRGSAARVVKWFNGLLPLGRVNVGVVYWFNHHHYHYGALNRNIIYSYYVLIPLV